MAVVAARRAWLGSRWHAFEQWVGTRVSAAALFVVALTVFALESVVLPAYPGRDMSRYLQAFVQLGYHVPVYPAVLNTRGPLAALGVGVPLEAGGWFAEIFLAVLFALSVVAWARVAYVFGSRAAIAVSVVLLLSPGYAILFHQLASDSLFAAAFAGWALLCTRAILAPSTGRFLLVGVAAGALVLVRPANQVLLVLALLPLLLARPWRERLAFAAAWFIPGALIVQIWKAIADWRWGTAVTLKPSIGFLALAVVLVPLLLPGVWRVRAAAAVALLIVLGLVIHGWPVQSPSTYVTSVTQNASNQFTYRAFELDKIMSPDNGPASRRIAEIVRQRLLPIEPYRSYGVTVRQFFSSGSDRVFGDLTGVAPPSDLARATREAIRKHPGTFARSIGQTVFDELARRPVFAPDVARVSTSTAPTQAQQQTDYVTVNGRRLPKPTEGQPIPASAIGPMLWPPGATREVWTSPTAHHTVVTDARDRRRIASFNNAVDRLDTRLPTRDGDAGAIHRLNQGSHGFPPALLWLILGVGALAFRRPRRALVAIAPALAGLIVVAASSLVAPSVAEYGAPVTPAFIVLAGAGVFAPAQRDRSFASFGRYARLVIGGVAAVWAALIYGRQIHVAATSSALPNDLAVFLRATGKVLHAASPYTYLGDKTFAYPPFVAWLLAPLHPFGQSTQTLIWIVLCLAAIAGALWLLGVRDWTCYALAYVFMFTRSSIELGTVEPLLLLAVAAAWRWRDRVIQSASAVGVAIVMKLFLWPLVVWLALMRRVPAAVAAVGVVIALAFVSWAAIGFAGLGDYSSVLRRLSHDEGPSSYSVVALGVRAHLPLLAARVLSVLVTIALLAAAAWVARDRCRTAHDRDVACVTLALAAGLASSPIVWVHYFLVLLVPLALVRPRFSPLWLVPLAYYPLGISEWPAGDARKLAIALIATLVIVGAAVVRADDLRRLPPWLRIRSTS